MDGQTEKSFVSVCTSMSGSGAALSPVPPRAICLGEETTPHQHQHTCEHALASEQPWRNARPVGAPESAERELGSAPNGDTLRTRTRVGVSELRKTGRLPHQATTSRSVVSTSGIGEMLLPEVVPRCFDHLV